jgi:hypothetical protein
MSGAADRVLHRGALIAASVAIAVLPWPWVTGLANPSYLAVLLATVPLWVLLAALHEPSERAVFLRIGVIGLAARLATHLAVFAWSTAGGGPYLGPDSSTYLHESGLLALRGFAIDGPPALFFGSYDCAHYYLFAAATRYLGADLYGLQTLNLALTAFAGPLFYSMWRRLGIRHAVLLGAGVALYPSLIALSINDLLKDPSIFAATTLGLWCLVRLGGADARARIVVLVALGSLALIYVRMSRFYVVAFLEIAVAAAILGRWVRERPGALAWRASSTAAPLAITLLLVELVPLAAGWPLTPRLVAGAVRHSVETPGMHQYGAGLVERAAMASPAAAKTLASTDESRSAIAARPAPDAPVRGGTGERREREVSVATAPEGPPVAPPAASVSGRVVRASANAVRKLLGPFPWVPPPTWTARTLLLGDYLLFPGMLVWYALFPIGIVGLAVVALRVVRREAIPLALTALGGFAILLLVQYMALNLSYRQREFMVPFLAAAALLMFQYFRPTRVMKLAYGAYWILIVLLATAHLAVRAAMR